MDIQIKLCTDRYALTASFEKIARNKWMFDLEARVIGTELRSTVMTVNAILDTLTDAMNTDDYERFVENTWSVYDPEVALLVKEIMKWERDADWLEDALDEDRAEGEWSFPSDEGNDD